MKKLLIIIFIIALLLSGCAAKSRPYTVADADRLLKSGAFAGDMARVESSVVPLLYGIDADELVDYVSYQTASTALSADELTILIFSDEDAAIKACESCRARVESQIKNCELYCPSAIPNLEAAVIDRVENTVLLAVGDPELISSALSELRD